MNGKQGSRRPVLLAGPPSSALGGVATHVRTLSACLIATGIPVERLELGSAAWGSGSGRLIGLLQATQRIRRGSGPVYLNPSFDQGSLLRDGLLVRIARSARRPTIVHFHGGLPGKALASGPAAEWFRRTLATADRLFVLNRRQQADLAQVRPDATIMDYVVDVPDKPISQVGRPARTILFLSRLAADKGLLDLIDAVAILGTRSRDIRLLVGGDGPQRKEALAHARSRHVPLQYLGVLRGPQIRSAHAQADVFALPSYHAEGFPLAVLEAMASGLPIVCSAQGAIPDRLSHGTHALFVAPRNPEALAESLARLLSEVELRRGMQRANRDYVANNHSCGVLGPRYQDALAGL